MKLVHILIEQSMKEKTLEDMTRCFQHTTNRNTNNAHTTNDVSRWNENCACNSEVNKLKSPQSKENKNTLNLLDEKHPVLEKKHYFDKQKVTRSSRFHAQQIRRILQTRFNPYPKETFDKIPKAHDHNNQLFKGVKQWRSDQVVMPIEVVYIILLVSFRLKCIQRSTKMNGTQNYDFSFCCCCCWYRSCGNSLSLDMTSSRTGRSSLSASLSESEEYESELSRVTWVPHHWVRSLWGERKVQNGH